MSLESQFQAEVIKDLHEEFPACVVLKNDPNYIQGIPDLLILYEDKWAALETKRQSNSHLRPNQGYYVRQFDEMSFARFINPDNKEEVFDELREAFRARRHSRVLKSK